MPDIIVSPELWPTNLLPEGILEQWRYPSRTVVAQGEAIAEVRIGEDLHEIISPAAGVMTVDLSPNSVVEPGTVIGTVRATSSTSAGPA